MRLRARPRLRADFAVGAPADESAPRETAANCSHAVGAAPVAPLRRFFVAILFSCASRAPGSRRRRGSRERLLNYFDALGDERVLEQDAVAADFVPHVTVERFIAHCRTALAAQYVARLGGLDADCDVLALAAAND